MIDKSNINIFRASLIVEELIRNGTDYFCVSPGSRSAPLTVAVARNAKAKHIVCFDERGAAFHALGYARATGKPAALICTSGSAAAHYLPAVTEADADMIPMIILSADRPPELLKRGANQTTNQADMFRAFTRDQSNLNISDRGLTHEYILREIDDLYSKSIGNYAGPVHINCMFREPLAPVDDGIEIEISPKLEHWKGSFEPFCSYADVLLTASDEVIETTADILNNSDKTLLIVGHLRDKKDQDSIRKLIRKLNCPVFPDIRSGLRFGENNSGYSSYCDQILQTTETAVFDTILHIGGNFVSKRLTLFLERTAPKNYIHVDNHHLINDPGNLQTMRIESDVSDFCKRINERLKNNKPSELVNLYAEQSRLINDTIDSYQVSANSEFIVAKDITQLAETALYSASSMPVRYFDMFAGRADSNLDFAANRGVSGIDGTIASATGFAAGQKKDTCLLIGDLAFIHDLNSLTLIKSIEQNIIIVLINNGGGGIFSHLPIADHEDIFEEYFGTPHNYDFKGTVENFGLKYIKANIGNDFRDTFSKVQSAGESCVIEIKTDRTESYKQLKKLQEEISVALSKSYK